MTATVYRVVTLRADGSMVGFDGPYTSPGTAKRVLRTVSAGLSSSNPSGGVKAEIQSLTGEWVSEARPLGFQKTLFPNVARIPEAVQDAIRDDTRSRLAENPIDRFPDAGYTSQD